MTAATPETGPTKRTVVIAEDEALIRMDLAEMLTDEGYDVVGQAADGAKAIELGSYAHAVAGTPCRRCCFAASER